MNKYKYFAQTILCDIYTLENFPKNSLRKQLTKKHIRSNIETLMTNVVKNRLKKLKKLGIKNQTLWRPLIN